MALTLSLPHTTIEAGAAHLFIESGRFALFACLQRPIKGFPLVELSKHERGTGRRLVVGPLLIDAGFAQ